jgi:hypothetical protein
MRTKKIIRCISAFMSALLISASINLVAIAADDSLKLDLSENWVNNETVDITLNLTENPGNWSGAFDLLFDKDKMRPISASKIDSIYLSSLVTNIDDGTEVDKDTLDRIRITWADFSSLSNNTKTGKLVTIRFQIKPGVQGGDQLDVSIDADQSSFIYIDRDNGDKTIPAEVDNPTEPIIVPLNSIKLDLSENWVDKETVDITLNLTENPGHWSGAFDLLFEQDKVLPISASVPDDGIYSYIITNIDDDNTGVEKDKLDRIRITWANLSQLANNTQTGKLVTIRFQIKPGVQGGDQLNFSMEADPNAFLYLDRVNGDQKVPSETDNSKGSITVPLQQPVKLALSTDWVDHETVDVTLNLTENPGHWSGAFDLLFDKDKVLPISASVLGGIYSYLLTDIDDDAGVDKDTLDRIRIAWANIANTGNNIQTGKLVTIRFQIKPGVQSGDQLNFSIDADTSDFISIDRLNGDKKVPLEADNSKGTAIVPTPTTSSTSTTVTTTPTTSSTSTTVTTTPTTSSTSTTVTTTNTPALVESPQFPRYLPSSNRPVVVLPATSVTPTPVPVAPTPVPVAPTPVPVPAMVLRLVINNVVYTKSGVSYTSDVAPYISADNRTMVPIRLIAEAFGAKVDWEAASRTAVITKSNNTLRIVIDQPLPSDMGTAVIRNDRTLVPIRYISEQFGAKVDWDAQTQTVTITQ